MGKRTPPIFHYFHQIHNIPEERDTQGTVELAVEDPEKPVVCRMKPGNVYGRLLVITIPMGNPGGDEIAIRFDVHAPDILQMRFNQDNPDNHERYGRNNRQIDERDTEDHFPEGLSFIVAADSHSIHYFFLFF
ncbi:MAG TPA: hypothetical protein VFY07_06245 [Geomobilimonas sp.]|nr:hypothetical protein [Geomobilimonas sp.]